MSTMKKQSPQRSSAYTNFAKFTGKHLFQSLFFNRVAVLQPATLFFLFFHYYYYFFNWDSLHAKLNSHYVAWSYKKKKHKKITAYKKYVQKEPTVKRRLLILDLKPLRSQVKGKHSIGREFQSLAVRGKKRFT